MRQQQTQQTLKWFILEHNFLLFVEFIVEKHCRIHEYNNDNNEYSSSDGSAAEK